jgi:hypothetical protein
MDTNTFFNCTCKVCSTETISSTVCGVNEMTSVVEGEVKKQKGAFNYDLYELKLDFLQNWNLL